VHLDALAISGKSGSGTARVAGPATSPSTSAQNRADRARSEQSITITSSPFL